MTSMLAYLIKSVNYSCFQRSHSFVGSRKRFNDAFVVGAGSIGKSLAISLLASNPANRVFLQVKDKYLEEYKQTGFHTKGAMEGGFFAGERFHLISKIDETLFVENEISKTSIVFSATKAIDVVPSLLSFSRLTDFNPVVVCLQNGLGTEEEVRQNFHRSSALKGHVFGAVHQKDEYLFAYKGKILVEDGGESTSQTLTEMFRDQDKGIFNLEISPHIYIDIYPKIAVNCVCNPLTIILNQNLGKIRAEYEELVRLICHEIYFVALAQGVELGSSEKLSEFVLAMMEKFSEHYSSMYLDHVSGKETEIDYINGGILKIAREKGIDVPINVLLVKSIKDIQRKRASVCSAEEFYQMHDLYLQDIINQLKTFH